MSVGWYAGAGMFEMPTTDTSPSNMKTLLAMGRITQLTFLAPTNPWMQAAGDVAASLHASTTPSNTRTLIP